MTLASSKQLTPNRLSIVDLGTNSVRYFVFNRNESGVFYRECREKIMIRLGDGLFDDNQLTTDAMDRGVAAFNYFSVLNEQYKPDVVRIVATSALREATNAQSFIEAVRNQTGLEIEVISEAEEARLIALGVTSCVKDLGDEEPLLLVDIGGGSTEISLCSGRSVQFSKSLRFGAARSQQRFLQTIPPNSSDEKKLRESLREMLRELEGEFPFTSVARAVGSSGSIRAIGRIHEAETDKGLSFSVAYLKDFIERIRPYSREQLSRVPRLEPRRVDLILSACIILDELCSYFSATLVRPTSHSLIDGVLSEHN